MKPAPFAYYAPESVEEAVGLLGQHGDDAKLIAGGQSLVPMMAFRLATPAVLVDLNRVRELDYVRTDDGTLAIGALARHRSIEELPWARERAPILAEGVELIGHVAIRNRGTVGGSVAHADPSAEWPALLLAMDGQIDVTGPNGTRTVPARDFFVTYFTTALEPDEILTEVRLSLPGPRSGSAFVELARRHGDFAMTGVGAVLTTSDDGTVEDARVVLIGVRDTAVRSSAAEAVLTGRRATDDVIREAAAAVDGDIEPVGDLHASSEFRRHLARVLTGRALARARAPAARGTTS